MTDPLIARAESHDYQSLFIKDLRWGAPDTKPLTVVSADGQKFILNNVSSYHGVRVWVCDHRPGSQLEAQIDREVAKTSTDRILIFHDATNQVWRWPVRRVLGSSTTTRLTSHRHQTGKPNPKFLDRLLAITLPTTVDVDVNELLAKLRRAFDVETQNESKQASKLMARLYVAMTKGYGPEVSDIARDHQISVTLARLLFLMFGDDTNMWKVNLFEDYVHKHTDPDGTDIGAKLTNLFLHLDAPQAGVAFSELADFPYVNGGIFHEHLTLPVLNADFRTAILDASAVDWSTISPAIFGSMFQSVRSAEIRRALGEHYTSEENILKTLNPLFLDDLRAEYERASRLKTSQALHKLWDRLGEIQFMDPACGCGNFVIIAYREMRDLELQVMERIKELENDLRLEFLPEQRLKVTLDHFYGIEIDEWPAKIAETAMFLIDRQCDLKLKERFGEAPERLPIQKQSKIVVGNATRLNWREIFTPNENTIVAGNPPFIGQYTKTDDQTEDAKFAWGQDYDGYLDYVTSWHAKALQFLRGLNARWAFVTTNSITQGVAVPALFKPIYRDGWRISFAHRTFAWTSEASGKAAVHCVIVGFTRDSCTKARLFDYKTPTSTPIETAVSNVNAYLLDGRDLLVEKRMRPLASHLPEVQYGSKPADGGFLQIKDRKTFVIATSDTIAAMYVRPFKGADELLNGKDRWCLWLVNATNQELATSPFLADRLEKVSTMRRKSTKDSTVLAGDFPHLFTEIRQPDVSYLAIPRHVTEARRYFTAARFDSNTICGDANFAATDADGFLFAIISSSMFIAWQRMIGGRIKSDLRFSNTVTWNNLPVPPMSAEIRAAIVEAGKGVVAVRDQHLGASLAELYEPDAMDPALLAAHGRLDDLVDRAFGATVTCDSEFQRQQILFDRYAELSGSQAPGRGTERVGRQ